MRHALRVDATPFTLAAVVLIVLGAARAWGHLRIPWSPTQAQVPRHWIVRFRTWKVALAWGLMLGSGVATRVVAAVLYAGLCLSAVVGTAWAAAAGGLYGLCRALPLLAVGLPPGSRTARFGRHMAVQDRFTFAPQIECAAGLAVAGVLLRGLQG